MKDAIHEVTQGPETRVGRQDLQSRKLLHFGSSEDGRGKSPFSLGCSESANEDLSSCDAENGRIVTNLKMKKTDLLAFWLCGLKVKREP